MLRRFLDYFRGSPLSPSQQWALAVGAVQTHQGGHDCGRLENEGGQASGRESLGDGWGVHNRAEADKMLAWLETEGHNAPFLSCYQSLRKLDPIEQGEVLEAAGNRRGLYEYVIEHLDEFRDGHILAFDLTRVVNVCRFSVAAGYHQPEDVWPILMRNARRTQKTFRSWTHFGENYWLGIGFFCAGQGLTRIAVGKSYDYIRQHPRSPWMRLPWEMVIDG